LIKPKVGLTKTIIEARVTSRSDKHVWTVLVSIIYQKILTHAGIPNLVTFKIPIIILLWLVVIVLIGLKLVALLPVTSESVSLIEIHFLNCKVQLLISNHV